jgi:hypothetical protein
MKTQIICKTILVKRMGGYVHFDLRLPSNALRIKAVDCGFRLLSNASDIPRLDNSLTKIQIEPIGDLRLHRASDYECFYAFQLTDIIRANQKHNYLVDSSAMNKPYEYHGKHQSDSCDIALNTALIKGYFKDTLGAKYQLSISYQITICLHLEY